VRRVSVCHDVKWLRQRHGWPGLVAAIARVERRREIGETIMISAHYYIMSRALSAAEAAWVMRLHWRIENALHWVPDVTFREDDQPSRKDMVPQNLAAQPHPPGAIRRFHERKARTRRLAPDTSRNPSMPQHYLKCDCSGEAAGALALLA